MFGYIKPSPPELRVRDYELYKAFYCGLCRAMGLHICKSSRLTLSYDIVFLALVRVCAGDEPVTLRKRRCAAHPFKKRPVAECEEALPYSAAASALLSYYKVADDADDEHGLKRLAKKLLLPSARRYRRRAGNTELDMLISDGLARLYKLEASGTAVPDACADEFGHVLEAVFASSFGSPQDERILGTFGYHIGRWIYLVDAADDFPADKKSGSFNPFSSYEKLPADELVNALNLELAEAQKALALISSQNKPVFNIIENIIYLGMPETAARVLGVNNRKDTDIK